jgi:hypothetical protein
VLFIAVLSFARLFDKFVIWQPLSLRPTVSFEAYEFVGYFLYVVLMPTFWVAWLEPDPIEESTLLTKVQESSV